MGFRRAYQVKTSKHTCALVKIEGKAKVGCWGYDHHGQAPVPQQIHQEYDMATLEVGKNISLGKDISGVKLGVSARNLFTITDYSSYDPETSVNGGTGLSSGIEVTPFPSAKQFYFHLNVNF